MEIIAGICLAFCLLTLEKILEIKKQLNDLEKEVKLINHDLNMTSKTMENMHKEQVAKELRKQILNG